MTIKVIATIPELERYTTGLYTLDRALGFQGNNGMPVGSMVEMYGKWESGKTTLALYLAGMVQPEGRIVIGDLEGSLKPDYLVSVLAQAGFDGTVELVDWKEGKKVKTHEGIAKETADALMEEDVSAVMLDSVGAFQPKVEREGDIEEAFMGKRAQAMSKYPRRCAAWLRLTDFTKMSFIINHVLTKMGSKGLTTPGGDAIKFLSRVRMRMWRTWGNEKPNYSAEDGFLARVKVEKMTFGGSHGGERIGQVFIIPGIGVSQPMTAVFDCIALGLADRTSHGIKVPYIIAGKEEKKVAGKLKVLIKDASEGKEKRFKRFYELLQEAKDDTEIQDGLEDAE